MGPKRDKNDRPVAVKPPNKKNKNSADSENANCSERLTEAEVEAKVRAGKTQIPDTERGYKVYLAKFAAHIGTDLKNLKSDNFSDNAIAGFITDLGEENSFKPHVKKTCMAAFHDVFIKVNPPRLNIYKFPSEWPLTTLAIAV